ncbi:MAG: M48 family metallopeptidase [Gammaproteobacteria bacterium]|nr:M48 family metallopeptidase [Gammaproteobacteria bacterium]
MRKNTLTIFNLSMVLLLSSMNLHAALLVSEREIVVQSEQQWEQMKQSIPISRDLKKRTLVRCVARNIIKQIEEPYSSFDWEIEVFQDPTANAVVLPAGKIGVNTGLFDVASNPNELAAVIGHEIAHVTNKHSYERAKRAKRTQVGALIGSAVVTSKIASKPIYTQSDLYEANNTISAINTMSQVLATYGLNLPYAREQESDADKSGIILMAKAGFNPIATMSLWKKMKKKDAEKRMPEFASTHPSSDTRISGLASQLSDALEAYNKVEKKPNCNY